MIYSLPHNKFRNLTTLAILALLVASCGSYQQASYYDNDGIYAGEDPVMVERRSTTTQKSDKNDTYSDYFGQKANQYDEILDSEIFTDVDSYSSNGGGKTIPQDQLTDYYNNGNDYQGYGGWGDNATNVSINIYDNGWNNWGYGYYGSPLLWNNWGYGGFYGYGWGWNNPWRYNGWNNWGWGGYGYGWNSPWVWGGYGYAGYGYGWHAPLHYYGYGNYNRNYGRTYRSYAYNNSRRGNYNTNVSRNGSSATALRGRSNVNTRGDSPRYRSTATTRSSSNTRSARNYSGNSSIRRGMVGVDQNQNYRTSRSTRATPRYSTSSRNQSSYSTRSGNSSSSMSGSRAMTPRTSTYRSSGNSGYSTGRSGSSYSTGRSSSGGVYRSSGSSSRGSSGSMRSSSSGSSRSSGSSGRSSGRRN